MNDALPRLDGYLGHILEAIDRIGRYVGGMDEASFLGNLLVQDAVVRNIEIIGEASNKIEKHFPAFAAEHPELPLTSAYQMRNAVAHGYLRSTSGSSGRRSAATFRPCARASSRPARVSRADSACQPLVCGDELFKAVLLSVDTDEQ